METEILHQRENNEWSEGFLKENGQKFSNQCVDVLRLLYKGMRLTAKQTNDILNIADGGRRLRDIIKFKKECRKAARRNAEGKFEGVEYWLEIPRLPTKSEVIANAERGMESLKKAEKVLVTVFSLPDNPIVYIQPSLFLK